jgi:hypothetical protein
MHCRIAYCLLTDPSNEGYHRDRAKTDCVCASVFKASAEMSTCEPIHAPIR